MSLAALGMLGSRCYQIELDLLSVSRKIATDVQCADRSKAKRRNPADKGGASLKHSGFGYRTTILLSWAHLLSTSANKTNQQRRGSALILAHAIDLLTV
jgi:hypothetical protein